MVCDILNSHSKIKPESTKREICDTKYDDNLVVLELLNHPTCYVGTEREVVEERRRGREGGREGKRERERERERGGVPDATPSYAR